MSAKAILRIKDQRNRGKFMATLTIELSDELIAELNDRQVSDELIHLLVEHSLRAWLRKAPDISSEPETKDGHASPFAESAISFIEQLIDENPTLFERLAKL
jgi:hypothetical protein